MRHLKTLLPALGPDNLLGMTAQADLAVGALRTDSRDVLPGDLFAAVRGDRNDGHAYIRHAVSNGAACILLEDPSFLPFCRDTPFLFCRDVRAAVSRIRFREAGDPQKRIRAVGVTGTNGKTSVVFLLYHIFRACGIRCAMLGTVREEIDGREAPSRMTTPDPAALASFFRRADMAGCEYIFMEVSSHALDQHRVEAIPFSLGIFTGLSRDHLDYHATEDAYFAAKRRLFLQSRQALIQTDHAPGRRLFLEEALPCRLYSYASESGAKEADFSARDVRCGADLRFFYLGKTGIRRIVSPLCGSFFADNLTAALAASELFGLPLADAAAAAAAVDRIPGRMERLTADAPYTVLLDYAHTPNALENAAHAARTLCSRGGRLFLLFGCGGDRDRGKRPLMGEAAARLSDRVYLTEDNSRSEDPLKIMEEIASGFPPGADAVTIPSRREAVLRALSELCAGDVLLLAGKGHEETLDRGGASPIPFSERELVRQFLKEQGL